MRAIVQDGYGPADRLRLAEVDRPAVGDDEVLLRMRATSVHPDVWHVVTGRPFVPRPKGSGLHRPTGRIPGTDVAGTVEAAGHAVTRFQPGDEVFGKTLRGYSWRNGGAFAHYVSVPQSRLAVKPPNITFERAATVPTAGYIVLANLHPDRSSPASGCWSTGRPVASERSPRSSRRLVART
ncbi:alcohol dehydrogenase catalytic domain-containing protein [Phytohabitans sp. LJ34]|uniref:alcohol dehydrogenase catalytic domain-containing protein n=1 Tax=Phytohabitans sp. LJ34 TaxID=3452217 RepID=UPI003F898FBB